MADNLGRATLVRNPEYERNGLKSYVRALQKYGITPTVDGPFSGRPGEVQVEDVEHNTLYIAESTLLPADICKDGRHAIFDPKKSSTWKEDRTSNWQIAYGDKSTASGTVGTDNLDIGGLIVRNQAIELATSVSKAFVDNRGDGLLGLSFGSNNSVKPFAVATPVENMILQDDIPPQAELFTAWLGSKLEPSFFTFGYIDEKALQGQQPTYTSLDNSQGTWMFESSIASINGLQYARFGNRALADTGTTLCLVSDSLCEKIYSSIPGATKSTTQQGWILPTPTDLSTLPKVAFSVGNALFHIKPADFAFQDLGDGTTYGGIQSRGNQDFDVLGCVFLRCIYAIFDQGSSRFEASAAAAAFDDLFWTAKVAAEKDDDEALALLHGD
ncbi:hypothetical protein MBLNU13_g07734t2 [Cladosporium sp. NU13]